MSSNMQCCTASQPSMLSAGGHPGTGCTPVVACDWAQGLVEQVGARAVLLDNSPGAANREGCTEALLDLASSAAADGASAAWLLPPAQAPSQEQQARPPAATLERVCCDTREEDDTCQTSTCSASFSFPNLGTALFLFKILCNATQSKLLPQKFLVTEIGDDC